MTNRHTPVLLKEFLELTRHKAGGIYVDATIGNGGHAVALLKNKPEIKLLAGIDCDKDATILAEKNLEAFADKVILLHGNFRNLKTILEQAGIYKIDGILFDLGLSMTQLKQADRGLSFRLKGPLDMRLDRSTPLQAKDLVNRSPARDLEKIIKEYGEESWAKRIALNIIDYRRKNPISDTLELADLVYRSIPRKFHPKHIHPATKTFQAFRIAVNNELPTIEDGLDNAIEMLNPGGRICAISFHSLEDRLVKNRFKQWEKGCICPPAIPFCICKKEKQLKIITKKPVRASEEEKIKNPASRSALMRVGEKI